LSLLRRGTDGQSRLVPLIAGLIALLGVGAAATAALGSWDGGSKLECAHSTVHQCVYDAPQTTITAGPTGYTNDATPSFAFSANQLQAEFTCRVDDDRIPKCDSTLTVGKLGNGTHVFEVLARSNGHTEDETPATRSFVVDTTAPVTTITGGPTSPTNDSTPSFTFKSNETGSTFQCRVDRGAFTSCTSAKALGRLGDGNHTLYVRATDRAKNIDLTPASRPFTVDTRAPVTTITSGPSGMTTDKTPTFAFKSSEASSTFQCRVDRGAFASCRSPRTTAPLAPGSHTFSVRATDRAANTDATAAVRSVTVKTGKRSR
jgi:hypothetical protein